MTFTGRMRLSLFLVALLPPIVAVGAVYLYTSNDAREKRQLDAYEAIERYQQYETRFISGMIGRSEEIAVSEPVRSAALYLTGGRSGRISNLERPNGVDFLEIIDSSGRVLASAHRPGLVGERLRAAPADSVAFTIEYDRSGRHPAVACVRNLGGNLNMYTGRYLDESFLDAASAYADADVYVAFIEDPNNRLARLEPEEIYAINDSLVAVLGGSADDGFVIVASQQGSDGPRAASLVGVTIIVSVISILVALAIGWYLTNRAKREVDNLIEASERVAEGDFTTPVMAYEEGEFSLLADAMTDMMSNLKRTQQQLATAEKVAAWQAMGRKIAHEVKNPLTPISVSVDDLRRSFEEQLPGFDRTLKETTTTIKAEIRRMTRMLDEFVSFARMSPPIMSRVTIGQIFEHLRTLYRREIDDGRILLSEERSDTSFTADPDKLKQVLVNLIKNSLETGDKTTVSISTAVSVSDIVITVTDTGPGFPPELLDNAFEPQVSRKQDGFGLGLVICQRIIHDHGGSITLQNDPDGARVDIQLPRDNG